VEIKSYHFETLFSRIFSGSSISRKKVSGKKSYYCGKCMGTNDVYNHAKKGLDIKNTPGYI